MKLLLITTVFFIFFSCSEKKSPPTLQQAPETMEEGLREITISQEEYESLQEGEQEKLDSIIEENDFCICTKDYRPVCGKNGLTYPNACQAECDGVTVYTPGSCSDEKKK
jgi:hypothetical protein